MGGWPKLVGAYTRQWLSYQWLWEQRGYAFRRVFVTFALSRLAFYLAAVFGTWLLPEAIDEPNRFMVNGRLALALHWRWDAIHYYTLSNDGYGPNPLAAYFPLLPLLIHMLATLLRGGHAPTPLPIAQAESAPLIAGVIIAHLAALLAFWLLFVLVHEETGDPAVAHRTVLYTAIFPLALYYAVPYTESLFLAASVGTFLAARRGHWIRAGLWAAVASSTRFVGILLLPVLLVEIGVAWWRNDRWKGWPRAILGLLLAPLGLLLFMLLLWHRTGDPLAFIHAQATWSHVRTWPWITVLRGIQYALDPALSPTPDLYGRGVLHTLIVLGFLTVLLVSIRTWRPSYVLYGVLLFAVILSSPLEGARTMHSLGRYIMILFPVYITLAQWGRRDEVHQAIVLCWLPLLGLLTALYVRWYPVA